MEGRTEGEREEEEGGEEGDEETQHCSKVEVRCHWRRGASSARKRA